ncbi:MAG: phenylalanine--tRNA ligase subunit alpha [Patescibacteria group bacterium]|nr:phenylalanine--tRNA ligase subunit alpha [Patescibacteria group bacterium]MDD5121434.1 phenylalanine--tRNA ligase subunit alpha [Patescibacteria group bacterium]MDD5222342.1 phenylalanine--tRNA ligase subunit alpha [Patescibacteria group bacterium]MDD5395647.1 phenylalanine--tRNA ligase subunit alpha [Patescibacteria group bacterium]
MKESLENLKNSALQEIRTAGGFNSLEELWRKYLGRNGQLRNFSIKIKDMTPQEKAEMGRLINEVKNILESTINNRKNDLSVADSRQVDDLPDLNLNLTDQTIKLGHLHPHTQMKMRVADIFHSMGWQVLEGPEVENEHYHFDVLNIPANHPARDMWDTFWLNHQPSKNGRLLLRAHTSAMQVRVMEKQKPPLKVCVIGKCYRHEATDARHEHSLYQIEGFVVDKNVSVANLLHTLKTFLHYLFGRDVEVRLRPSYFPFTEPSFELDFSCLRCGGQGCPVCGQSGWVEMLGCGMIHPNVLRAAGYLPAGRQVQPQYTGFAFGIGLDRLVMMRHKVDDIRWFNGGDLRFLRQF